MRPVSLGLALALTPVIWRRRQGEASDLDVAIGAYLWLSALGFWLFPASLGYLLAAYPETALYIVLFGAAALPPILSGEPFTTYFARRQAPEAVWETALFKEINRHLTGFWAALFALGALATLLPQIWPEVLDSLWGRVLCQAVLPLALFAGVGAPVTKWYPMYRQRQAGFLQCRPEQINTQNADRCGRHPPLG